MCPRHELREVGLLPLGVEGDVPAVETTPWGRLWAPRNLSELVAVAGRAGLGHFDGWRGHADIEWRLDSGAVRRLLQAEPYLRPERLEETVQRYETQLLDNARIAGHGHHEGRRLGDLELLALLQHHGAATRLLDFTENLLVATWFACQAHLEGFGLLVGVDLAEAWWIDDPAWLGRRPHEVLEEAAGRLIRWKPEALSRRIPSQHAFHLWSRATYRDWGSLASDALSPSFDGATSQISEEMAAIAVSPELKAAMRPLWRPLFGYSTASLFPDLDGFATVNGPNEELGEDFLRVV